MQTHHPQELKKLLSKYDSAYLDHIEKLDFDERVKIAAKNPDLLYILYDDEYEYEKSDTKPFYRPHQILHHYIYQTMC